MDESMALTAMMKMKTHCLFYLEYVSMSYAVILFWKKTEQKGVIGDEGGIEFSWSITLPCGAFLLAHFHLEKEKPASPFCLPVSPCQDWTPVS